MSIDFNLTRLGYYLKRQLYMNISSMWIAIVAVVGVLLVISGLTAINSPNKIQNLVPLYLVVLFVGGYIFTSKIFSEMHSPQKAYAFLTLPVSTAEKIIGGLLIVAPVYLIIALAGILMLSFTSGLIAGQPMLIPSLTNKEFTYPIGTFLVTQTFFFLGAVAFRGNNFLKTLLALFIVTLIISAYSGGLGYLLFGKGHLQLGPESELKGTAEFIFKDVVPFLFWFVLPLYLLVVSYFKLKERQV